MASLLLAAGLGWGLTQLRGRITQNEADRQQVQMPGRATAAYASQLSHPFRAAPVRTLDALYTADSAMTTDARVSSAKTAGARSIVAERLDLLRADLNRSSELELATSRNTPSFGVNMAWQDRHFAPPSVSCQALLRPRDWQPGGHEREWRRRLGYGT